MGDANYSELLRDLSREYFNRAISFEVYRAKRQQLLGVLDLEYNGVETHGDTGGYGRTDTQPDFRKGSGQSKVETVVFYNHSKTKK